MNDAKQEARLAVVHVADKVSAMLRASDGKDIATALVRGTLVVVAVDEMAERIRTLLEVADLASPEEVPAWWLERIASDGGTT